MAYEDYYEYDNVFDQKTIDWFFEVYKKVDRGNEVKALRVEKPGRKNYLHYIDENVFPELYKQMVKTVTEVLPFRRTDYEIDSIQFYHIENPYALHSDGLGKDDIFYQLIIPLRVVPKVDTYTVVYDQTTDIRAEWISDAYNKPKDYKPIYNIPVYDPTQFGGWEDRQRISEEDGVKYWGKAWDHTFRKAYHGFSIKHVYKWRTGGLFCFNSYFTHSATEFKEMGIESKEAILVLLKRAR